MSANQTKSPVWEEELILNEDYLHIMSPYTLVTFEILDFMTSKRMLMGPTDGWYKACWAFLKPIGADGTINTEQKVRLQLYKYPQWQLPILLKDKQKPCVYYAYKARKSFYPASLYVTIKGIPNMKTKEMKGRSRLPTEIEVGKQTLEQVSLSLL